MLLQTKLGIPPRRRNVVARLRLLQKLDQSLANEHRLVLLSAPAGYGKSTLLAAWLAGRQEETAWLTLDAQDNDPVRFWTYAITALQMPCPGIGRGALTALRSSQRPAISLLLADILNAIAALDHAHPRARRLPRYHLCGCA